MVLPEGYGSLPDNTILGVFHVFFATNGRRKSFVGACLRDAALSLSFAKEMHTDEDELQPSLELSTHRWVTVGLSQFCRSWLRKVSRLDSEEYC